MSWISSLFGNKRTYSSKRGQALSSTHDAFSIPTSSPGFPHGDALNGDSFSDTAASPSYTYPPPASPNSYDFVSATPTTAGRQSSLLPLYQGPKHSYPSLEHTWARLRNWLSREYPELGDTLNWGMLPEDLLQVEMQFGFDLPSAVRDSYLAVDGQEPESSTGCSEGLFFGLTLLPLEDVLDEWRFWREVDDDPNTGANARLRESMRSVPTGWIRNEYSSRGWIPLAADKAGNYIGVDMTPGEGGAPGQVIIFGRDYDTKVVLWQGDGPAGWAKWLAAFVDELESGEGFEVGILSDAGSDASEDEVGYEGYFFDGTGPGGGVSADAHAAGGLRLTGEYRGWGILDAWADRSIRRWHEAGVLQDETMVPPAPRDKRQSRLGLGVITLDGTSGAEVPIPVLAESTGDKMPTIPENEKAQSPVPAPVPSISLTKAPAPQPVLLPTALDYSSDVDDAEEEFQSTYRDGDLEAGQGSVNSLDGYAPSSIVRSNARSSSDAGTVEDPPPSTPTDAATSTAPTPRIEIPDLLADDTTEELSTPIQPSHSPVISISAPAASTESAPTSPVSPVSGSDGISETEAEADLSPNEEAKDETKDVA